MIRHKLLALGACAIAACAAVTAAAPGSAEAFVRYRTTTGQPYSWRSKAVSILGYPSGLSSVPVDQITTAMTAAVSAWSKEDPTNATCSYLELDLAMQPVTAAPPDAVRDYANIIAIRDGRWTSICSTSKDGKTDCHQSGELALTTVWSRSCGEIVEADVEVNADRTGGSLNIMWADLDVTTAAGAGQLHDLQNALTHEMGHFIGLDHTCVLNGAYQVDKDGNRIIPTDNLGHDVLDCTDPGVTVAEEESTMYPSANPGDTDKRSLSDDDHLGLCSIYPINTSPVSCGGGTSGGCSVGAAGSGAAEPPPATGARWRWLFVALTGLSVVVLATRRRRR